MNNNGIPTIDGDEFDADAYGVPTQRVRIVDSMEFGVPTSKGGVPEIPDEFEVEVPDMDRIDAFLKGKYGSIGTKQLQKSAVEERKEAIRKKSWEAVREIGRESDVKHYDASDEDRFIDVIYEAARVLEHQAGKPEDAEIFANSRTNRKVRNWMKDDVRLNSPTEDSDFGSRSLQVAGFHFQFLETPYLEDGEMVMADTELHAGPHSKPFTFVTDLPIGVEVTIKVNGRQNEIKVEK